MTMTEEEFKIRLLHLASDQENYDMICKGVEAMQFLLQFKEEIVNSKKLPVQKLLLEEQTMTKFQGVTVFRNPKAKTWYARKRIDGRQVYISGRSQRKVIEKLKRLLKIEEKKKPEGYTLASWYEKWLVVFKANVKERTKYDYNICYKNIPEEILDKKLLDIKPIDVVLFLETITSTRQCQKVFELLRMLFNDAEKMGIIQKNIMNNIDKPKHTRSKGIVLTKKEQEVFLQKCEGNKYSDVFKVLLFEGLRIGEALALTGEDISLSKNWINVDKSMTNSTVDTTKNTQSVRHVPLFQNTKILLTKYANYGKRRIFQVSYSVCERNFKQILKESDLDISISMHDLRHTFITNCKNKNIPEHIIQSWVGHEIGSKVTSQVYTHVTDEANLLYISKFEE